MKSALAIAKNGFKIGLHYRFNFLVGMLTVPLSLLVYYFLWQAVFNYSGEAMIRGFTFIQMVNYYTVSMIVGFFIWIDVDKWMAFDIKKGHTVRDLLRPISHLSQFFYREIGINSFGILLELVPVFILGFVFFKLPIASFFTFLLFFASLIFAFVLAFMLSYILGLSAFWLKEISGLRKVRRTLMSFLSGGLVPLTFFPEHVQTIFHYLPFEYMRAVPINIYIGSYTTWAALMQIGYQIIWVILLYILIKTIWMRAIKKFAGAGT